MQPYRRVCAYINRDAVIHNITNIKAAVKPDTKLMPVIKADGYGHGAVEMARLLVPFADYFAVAIIEEAINLRENGIDKPILLLGYTSPEFFETAIKNNVTVTIFTLEDARKLSKTAQKLGMVAKMHIAVDTGMRRIGFLPDEDSADIVKEISQLEALKLEGAFTHFATADEADKGFSLMQAELFQGFRKMLEDRNVKIDIYHVSNSAAIMELRDYNFDMVRPGIILYGLYPSDEVDRNTLDLKPVMELETHVAYIKDIKKGDTVSYGRTYTAEKDMRVATIPVGYADGYPRLASNKGRVIINGKYAPVLGRVCMDQFMVDVTDIDDVKVGDVVILIGSKGECNITADELAKNAQTINYEIVCGVSKRVPRVTR